MSKVYFADVKSNSESTGLLQKISKLYDISGFSKNVKNEEIIPIKLHFGEKGNTAFINPIFVRQIVDKLKLAGAKTYLTDTNTLYKGSRANAIDHLETAIQNGFAYAVVNAPLIIADGVSSKYSMEVEINKKHFKSVKIAGDIHGPEKMVVMSHFKGHAMAGFGGAIKNLAMGCATAAGKQQQHSVINPVVDDACIGCGICAKWCPQNAITIMDKKATVNDNCYGCGECVSVCPKNAIAPQWDSESNLFLERMTEYAYGAVAEKKEVLYINLLMNITPLCDCAGFSGAYLVPDIGILASTDPVAIDKASLDLINAQIGNPNSELKCNHEAHKDKFMGVHENVDGSIQLSYGEEIGLGSREYELIKI